MRKIVYIDLAFTLGDYAAGALVGLLTAATVHLLIGPTMDAVLAMLLGMVLGMVVHLVVGFLLMPLLGAFHTMVPASLNPEPAHPTTGRCRPELVPTKSAGRTCRAQVESST